MWGIRYCDLIIYYLVWLYLVSLFQSIVFLLPFIIRAYVCIIYLLCVYMHATLLASVLCDAVAWSPRQISLWDNKVYLILIGRVGQWQGKGTGVTDMNRQMYETDTKADSDWVIWKHSEADLQYWALYFPDSYCWPSFICCDFHGWVKKQTPLRTWLSHSVITQVTPLTKSGLTVSLSHLVQKFTRVSYIFAVLATSHREYDKNNSSGWIYSIWKSFTYGIHEFPRSGRLGQAKQDSPLHEARLLHQPVMKQHEGWKIVLSAENDSWEQWTAWPVMLSALCFLKGEILQDWHLIKGSFQSIFWSGVWNWRSLIWVCERCRSGKHLQGCWQSQSAVSQSQQKQIYNIMQSVDGKRAAVLPQATFTPPPSHFAQMYFLSPGNWLVNIQLIG